MREYMPRQSRFVDPINIVLLAVLAVILFGYLIVARWDYEEARIRECAAKGKLYNLDKDTCYAKTQKD